MKHSSGFRRASVLVYSFILLGAATLLLLKDGVKGVLTVAPGGDRSPCHRHLSNTCRSNNPAASVGETIIITQSFQLKFIPSPLSRAGLEGLGGFRAWQLVTTSVEIKAAEQRAQVRDGGSPEKCR